MKKIWRKFCDWLIVKLGGITHKIFCETIADIAAEKHALEVDNQFLKKDISNLVRHNAELLCSNAQAEHDIKKLENFIAKTKAPKHEFVNIEYIALHGNEDNLKFFATQGLLDKVKQSNAIKYDFRDGVCAASLEVVL